MTINLQYADAIESAGIAPQNAGLIRLDAKTLARRRMQLNAQRFDSVAPGNGLHLAREVEFAYQEVLKEKYSPLSALTLFPTDSRVAPGALTYKIKRVSHQGQAKYHRGNSNDIPRVGASMDEEIRPVRHIVSMISLDFFEQQTSNFAGTNLRGELRDSAVRAIQEFLNTKTWHGSSEMDVYGVLNYPYVPKAASTVTIGSGSNAEDILEELHRLASLASEISDTTFMPNTLVLPVRQHNYIAQTKLSTTDLSETIKSSFLKDGIYIDSIVTAPELAGAGPNGEDVMLFYRRNDQNSITNVIPQGFTMLPVQEQNFNLSIPVYMSHGGVRMVDPLNNLVVYTPAAS